MRPYNDQARRALFHALEEAQRLGADPLDTEHLLVGLARLKEGTAAVILTRLGISLERILAEVERQGTQGLISHKHDLGVGTHGKQMLDFAFEEARGFGDSHIGPEHLLLGLIREPAGLGGKILRELASDAESARAQVAEIRSAKEPPR